MDLSNEKLMTVGVYLICLILSIAVHEYFHALVADRLGDSTPELRRVTPEPLEFRNDLWLLSHPDVLRSRRVRLLSDFLFDCLSERHALFEGDMPLAVD